MPQKWKSIKKGKKYSKSNKVEGKKEGRQKKKKDDWYLEGGNY